MRSAPLCVDVWVHARYARLLAAAERLGVARHGWPAAAKVSAAAANERLRRSSGGVCGGEDGCRGYAAAAAGWVNTSERKLRHWQ